MSETPVARLPYWEYMRVDSPQSYDDLKYDHAKMSLLLNEIDQRIKKLEEEIAWLRKDDTILTGAGAMD